MDSRFKFLPEPVNLQPSEHLPNSTHHYIHRPRYLTIVGTAAVARWRERSRQEQRALTVGVGPIIAGGKKRKIGEFAAGSLARTGQGSHRRCPTILVPRPGTLELLSGGSDAPDGSHLDNTGRSCVGTPRAPPLWQPGPRTAPRSQSRRCGGVSRAAAALHATPPGATRIHLRVSNYW